MSDPNENDTDDKHAPGHSLASPVIRLDLAAEAASLRTLPSWQARGHGAKTLAKYSDLRLVLLVLRAGARIQEHRTDHRVTIQTVAGSVELALADQRVDLPAGGVLVLDRQLAHDVLALEESVVLLTISGEASTTSERRMLQSGTVTEAPDAR